MESFKERIQGKATLARISSGDQLHLEVEGNRLLAALGHRGVVECAPTLVRLRTQKGGEIRVTGEGLVLDHISREAAIVSGRIYMIQLENIPDEEETV